MHIFKSYLHIWSKKMHILFYKLTTNSSKKNYFLFLPVQRPFGGLRFLNFEAYPKKIFKLGKIYHIRMILFPITYPLSPKIKPIHTVFANVSKLPLPPLLTRSKALQTLYLESLSFYLALHLEIFFLQFHKFSKKIKK